MLVNQGVDNRNIYQEKINGTKAYREQLDTSSDNPYSSFLLTIMSGLSQLEMYLISRSAKIRERNGGRPSKRNDKADTVGLLYKEGYKIVYIVK